MKDGIVKDVLVWFDEHPVAYIFCIAVLFAIVRGFLTG